MTAQDIVKALDLVPLEVEGGMYRGTYASKIEVDGKPICTAIYYLLTDRSFSHMHRLPTDEIYHFYLGDPVELVELLPDGSYRTTVLGSDILSGQKVQSVAVAGAWQGSCLLPGGKFVLLGTTMSPGYGPGDYEHGDRQGLSEKYPDAAKLIENRTGEAVFI